jgi:4-hydroxybenzoate polyprenyltransferase
MPVTTERDVSLMSSVDTGQPATALGADPSRRLLPDFLRQMPYTVVAMRPKQWTKNGLVLLALVFARKLTDLGTVERGVAAFFAFSLAASAVYIVNDLADRENDRLHPKKSRRPIAAGQLGVPLAVATALACLCGAAALTFWLVTRDAVGVADPFHKWGGGSALFVATISGYFLLNVFYSAWLKHQVLWDVFIVAAGFVLRALAGAFAVLVPISPWFYLATTFLALFLALGKRRAEMAQLGEDAGRHRAILRDYTMQLLDQLLAVVVTCTLITYSLYTFQGENASHALMITIPFVLFGVFRYMYLIYVKHEGGQPDEVLLHDRQILSAVVLCVLTVLVLLYGLPLAQQ